MAKKQGNGEPTKKKSSGPGKLIGRIVVYGALAVLLVLAVLDFRVKSAAEATGAAWIEALNKAPDDAELTLSQLEKHIEGSPVSENRNAIFMRESVVDSIETYTWNGTFSEYKVYVGLGLGHDPSIMDVAGPGVEDPLVEQ